MRAAFESVAVALEGKARHADDTAQQILKATALIARDKGLVKAADKQLAAGRGRATAIANAVEEYCVQFEALGGYFAERVTDLRDVGSRAVAAVLGVPAPGVPDFSEPSVVVAEDLAPAETATLDRSLVVGIVTEAGGRTSHTAILAGPDRHPGGRPARRAPPASRPARRSRSTATPARSPSTPTSALVEAQRVRREKRRPPLASGSGPGVTRDGHHVALLANIGGVQDAEAAGGARPRGRRAVPHRVRVPRPPTGAPTVEEQAEIYRRCSGPFGARRVVVRTLDAGADKPLAFADLGPEENPALGSARAAPVGRAARAARRPARGARRRRQGHRCRRAGDGADGRHRRGGRVVRRAGPRRTGCPRPG